MSLGGWSANLPLRGSEHSTLGEAAHKAADWLKLDVSPDPVPDLVLFIRSDPYSFVKQGVHSVFASAGIKSSDPKIKPREIATTWRLTNYHKSQDDMSHSFDFESDAKYARYVFLLGYVVAQETEKPTWNPGDFFSEHFAKKN